MNFIQKTYLIIAVFITQINASYSAVKQLDTNNNVDKIKINSLWKFHQGDDFHWSQSSFNDIAWTKKKISLDITASENKMFKGICWFRQKIYISPKNVHKNFALLLNHQGASEIYVNGNLLKKFGKIGSLRQSERPYQPKEVPIGIEFDKVGNNLIAIRYSNHNYRSNFENYGQKKAGIQSFEIKSLNESIESIYSSQMLIICIFSIFIGILITLSLFHALLFVFYNKNKSNLFYSLFVFFYALLFIFIACNIITNNPKIELVVEYLINFVYPLIFFFLVTFLYSLYYRNFPKAFWVIFFLCCITLILIYINSSLYTLGSLIVILFVVFESIRVIITGVVKKIKGSKILGAGVVFFVVFICGIALIAFVSGDIKISTDNFYDGFFLLVFVTLALLSIPISMSIFLAKDFSDVNKDLENEKSNLEIRVIERTEALESQKNIVEEKNREILDSITYAKRIQSAILPPEKLIKSYFPDSFILYKPKDIVAGDFYWFEVIDDTIFFAAADCTGHGVPGAMVSVVCHNALNRSVKEYGLKNPGEILDKTREIVVAEFEKSDEDVKDGMDISLAALRMSSDREIQSEKESESEIDSSLSFSAVTLLWSGAHNPLWIVRSNEIIEYKGDKQPIGKYAYSKPFKNHEIELKRGDEMYLFTDGFQDQFGGNKAINGGKKFKASQMKELLLSLKQVSMSEKRIQIEKAFENWKGDLEQIDDICIIGLKL